MKLSNKQTEPVKEGDLTPMIDMTFQLIAFFMVLINFSEVERTENILLPSSQLAKPPTEPPDAKILLNLRKNGVVNIAGKEIDNPESLTLKLREEIEHARLQSKPIEPKDIVVIIRSHMHTPMREVQELIATCQDSNLETFKLRVKEQVFSNN